MKKILSCCLVLIAANCIALADAYEFADLTIDRADGVYALDETIKVTAHIEKGSERTLVFSVLENESGYLLEKRCRLRPGDHVLFEQKFSKAVHLIFSLGPEGEKENISRVGAIVSPEDFRPGYSAPSDLRQFWDAQIADMRLSEPEVEMKAVKSPKEGFLCWSVKISMSEGNPVQGYLAMPENSPKGSLPLIIYTHQAGVIYSFNRASAAVAVENAARGRGALAFDINAHGLPDDRDQSYYDTLGSGELKNYQSRPVTGHKDFYFRLMYLRLVRAVDFLVQRPEWDGRRILVHGASQGGGQSGALAGIDSRITAAVLQVPALADWGGALDNGRKGGWPRAYAGASRKEPYCSILPYYDVALLLGMSRAKLMFEAGLLDESCPPSCVAASYNNAASADKTILFHPYRPHSSPDFDIRHKKDWEKKVRDEREAFIDEYLSAKLPADRTDSLAARAIAEKFAAAYEQGDLSTADYVIFESRHVPQMGGTPEELRDDLLPKQLKKNRKNPAKAELLEISYSHMDPMYGKDVFYAVYLARDTKHTLRLEKKNDVWKVDIAYLWMGDWYDWMPGY